MADPAVAESLAALHKKIDNLEDRVITVGSNLIDNHSEICVRVYHIDDKLEKHVAKLSAKIDALSTTAAPAAEPANTFDEFVAVPDIDDEDIDSSEADADRTIAALLRNPQLLEDNLLRDRKPALPEDVSQLPPQLLQQLRATGPNGVEQAQQLIRMLNAKRKPDEPTDKTDVKP